MDLNENILEAKRALTEKPILSTSVERIMILNESTGLHKELPQPLRFSFVLRTLLERVSVPVEEGDLIAGRCVDRELTEEEEEIFQAYRKSPDNARNLVFLASGHCIYDWEALLEKGLVGLRADAMRSLEAKKGDRAKEIFLRGMTEVYDAIIAYMLRTARAAKEKGMEELSERLTRAATEAPGSFDVALQLFYTVAFIDCAYITNNPTLTLGRLDTLLYPLYRKGIADGTLTREKAAALITDMYCKHNLMMGRGEHQVGGNKATGFDRICNFDAPQYLLLAGADRNGRCAANELTELFAECIVPEFKNPVAVVYYTPGMAAERPTLWQTLMKKALASSSLMFYNDADVIAAYEKIGLPREDCLDYNHFGCNWASPTIDAAWMQGGPNGLKFTADVTPEEREELRRPYFRCSSEHSWPEDFNRVLFELAGREDRGEELSIEDFYTAFLGRAERFFETKLNHLKKQLEVRKRAPSALLGYTDCFLSASIDRAECFAASAKYHFEFQAFQMFGTTVDCFITVDTLVYREKRLTLRRLADAVDTNFENSPEILALCRRVPKYGSGDSLADAHAKRLSHTYVDLVCRMNHPTLEETGLFLEPCMQSDTWHLKLGETYMATPNGRRAGEAFSQNTKPSNGAAMNGLTAMLNSMLSLPAGGLTSGALNLDVETKHFAGEEGAKLFGSILACYFDRGGLHAQVSSVNIADLEDARKNPDAHRDLRVRVTGYSGIYVDMCERLQEDIINRMK